LNREEKDIILSWGREFGITLSGFQTGFLAIYLEELGEWNNRFNLTGFSSRDRIIKELLLDSMIPAPFLPKECRLLDVGSGAGFPGIPLGICLPRSNIHLMESSRRKVSFLKQVIRHAKLSNIEVIRGRIEKEVNLLDHEGYHVITARAVAQLRQTLIWCAPYLIPGGLLVNFQGNRFENAISTSLDVMKKHQLFLDKSIPYRLPGKASMRYVLIFKRNE
jgi:16S rRNA (guanine527-N7)-methyltransferase